MNTDTTSYPSCSCVCQESDWMGSTLHIPAQPYQGGTLREQRIIARSLPADLLAVFSQALTELLALAPGEWGASVIRIERREAGLHLTISRDAGRIALPPLTHELAGADYLAFFDRLTSPEFLLDPTTKTI